MKKINLFLVVLLILLISTKGFSQTKIYLTPPKDKLDDYHFVNLSDSIYVEINYSEDMGYKYAQNYLLKSNIPNGKYEIYVDGIIGLRATIKDFKKEGDCVLYNRNGNIVSVTPYKLGKINGEVINYYNNGVISFRGVFVEDKAIDVTTSFDELGKTKAKNYYKNGNFIKQEIFGVDGEIKSTYYPPKN